LARLPLVFVIKQQTAALPSQENPNAIPEGETPHAVSMFCYDDLVDAAKPGDRVTVTGIYKAVPMRINPRQRQLKACCEAEGLCLGLTAAAMAHSQD
jgi:DNA replicative helicase MCM subunit Mcm2 (Cdc46/Mcm family)